MVRVSCEDNLRMANKRINVALPVPLHAKLKQIQKKSGWPISLLVREAVMEYIKKVRGSDSRE